MKTLDKLIREWRTRVAMKHLPEGVTSIFDIGCDDLFFLRRLPERIEKVGCDPRLANHISLPNIYAIKGYFPHEVVDLVKQNQFDCVVALAVFEHFPDELLNTAAKQISLMLKENGKLVVTIPSPLVDHILDFLTFLKLIDGQALEEHHHFDPDKLPEFFTPYLDLVYKSKFQFGLNNVFVFKRANSKNILE